MGIPKVKSGLDLLRLCKEDLAKAAVTIMLPPLFFCLDKKIWGTVATPPHLKLIQFLYYNNIVPRLCLKVNRYFYAIFVLHFVLHPAPIQCKIRHF